ncbi:hypothetical protein [uncultured Nitratireductor sp.]|uniref:hypothetical protein n=1 Tax=uncultured Nitratireductor sp. TaxID=520953 RepID=UPI0025D17289|nr:hypothetical protein [uncultured Nitratireductor sp.]
MIRSPALSDVDLIDLIARHGSAHARVIGRRTELHPAIAALIRALSAQTDMSASGATPVENPVEADVRNRLRLIMRAANSQSSHVRQVENPALPGAEKAAATLRAAAFSSEPGALERALSSVLGIPVEAAREITEFPTYGELIVALKALAFDDAAAFLLTAIVFPGLFVQRSAIGFFLERYRSLAPASAHQKLRDWRTGVSIPGRADQPAAISK